MHHTNPIRLTHLRVTAIALAAACGLIETSSSLDIPLVDDVMVFQNQPTLNYGAHPQYQRHQ